MSSLALNALPDPHDQVLSLQRALGEKTQQIIELERELRDEQIKNRKMEHSVQELRASLQPLYRGLQSIFGHIEDIGIPADSPAPSAKAAPAQNQVWESWKQKLGGATARTIDILMLHGELTQTQIRIHLGTNRMQTVYEVVSKLNRAGLINKDNGKVSLKELNR